MRTSTALVVLRFLLFLSSLEVSTATDNTPSNDAKYDATAKLMEWFTSNGGYINPKIEMRFASKDDPSSLAGVFALQDLKEDELLVEIPQKLIIKGGDVALADAIDCELVKVTMKEHAKGAESIYAPFIDYLFHQDRHFLSATWSPAGKELFHKLLGYNPETKEQLFPPQDPTQALDIRWIEKCGGTYDDPDEVHIATMAMTRSWEVVFIPIYDMFNHRNGDFHNIYSNSVYDFEEVEIRADRDIKAGEELYNSYNMCDDCGYRLTEYGTPEILRDYGFVEIYPQRFYFPDEDEYYWDHLGFDIDEVRDENGQATGEYEISWMPDLQPTAEDLSEMQNMFSHLQKFEESDLVSKPEDVTDFEWDTIRNFHSSLKIGLKHAIQEAIEFLDYEESTGYYEEENDEL